MNLFGALLLLVVSISAHEIRVVNRCPQDIWVGTFGDNNAIPLGGNFFLGRNQQRTFGVPDNWTSGRVWGKTGCDGSGYNCKTGEAPRGGRTTFSAVTLAEFGLDKYMGLDFYDISQVDGFNLPMTIAPFGTQAGDKCRRVSCRFNFQVCPENFKVKGAGGAVIACKSACSATRDPKYCCPEPQYNRDTCQTSDYSRLFKNQCPDAYSYAYDDSSSLFACHGQSPSSSGYEVTFCP